MTAGANAIIFGGRGGGVALASQSGSSALLRLSPSGATLAGVNAVDAVLSFGKNGVEILGNNSTGLYYSADNGQSFAAQSTDIAQVGDIRRIYTDGTRWLADTFSNKWLHSANRTNWTVVTIAALAPPGSMLGSAFGSISGIDYYIIIGLVTPGTCNIWYSTDRINFIQSNGGISYGLQHANSIAYGNGLFIATGNVNGGVNRSASGITFWTDDNLFGGWSGANAKIAYSPFNNRWVIIGNDQHTGLVRAQYGNAGAGSWVEATVPSELLSTIRTVVALKNGGFMAAGYYSDLSARAYYSADGTAWANIPNAELFQGLYGLVEL